MAGRKGKNIVDYFPHYCNHGKTIYILEQKYKSDGYTAWFKVLEKLGSNENHYIDCRNDADWEFLQASIPLMQTELSNILDLLAKLEAIHPELWEKKIIWSGKFIQNIEDAYKRRNDLCMQFNDLCKHLSIKCKHEYDNYGIIVDIKEQSIVEYSKLNKSIEYYKQEIKEFDNEKYKTLVAFLLGNNEINEPLEKCLLMKHPINRRNFDKLLKKSIDNGRKLTATILALENDQRQKKPKKIYDSFSMTISNWLDNSRK